MSQFKPPQFFTTVNSCVVNVGDDGSVQWIAVSSIKKAYAPDGGSSAVGSPYPGTILFGHKTDLVESAGFTARSGSGQLAIFIGDAGDDHSCFVLVDSPSFESTYHSGNGKWV